MNRIVIACALFSLAAAAVIPDEAQAQIVKYNNDNDGTGNYEFSFETSNGIKRKETGRLINAGEVNQYVLVEGTFSYTDTDGKLVEINYRADENGYQEVPAISQFEPVPEIQVVSALPPSVVATLLGG